MLRLGLVFTICAAVYGCADLPRKSVDGISPGAVVHTNVDDGYVAGGVVHCRSIPEPVVSPVCNSAVIREQRRRQSRRYRREITADELAAARAQQKRFEETFDTSASQTTEATIAEHRGLEKALLESLSQELAQTLNEPAANADESGRER